MNRSEYLLTQFAEECNEVAQRVSKALRFGMQEEYQGKANEQYIADEFADLIAIGMLLEQEGIVRFHDLINDSMITTKQARVAEFFEYAKAQGTIIDESDTPDTQTKMPIINFYRTQDAYGCFSNFSPHGVLIDLKWWPTTEHYFQAQKFAGTPREEEVRLAKSPRIAADMGRDRAFPLRSDWEQVKNDVMLAALREKFGPCSHLAAILLETGNATLVEHTKNDSYWGDGGDGSGKNMLGKLLMQVRDELRKNGYDQCL